MSEYINFCVVCSTPFMHKKHGLKKYCSKSCNNAKRKERAAEKSVLTEEQRAVLRKEEAEKLAKTFIQPEYVRKRKLAALQRYKLKNPLSMLFSRSKHRAKRDGIEFTISEEDIIIPENMLCPILGIPIEHNAGKGYSTPNSASLDRIDNSKGYVPGNVCLISLKANRMKNSATREQLLKIIDYIDSYSKKS